MEDQREREQRGTGLARCSCAGGLVQRALTLRAHTVSAAARCRSSQLSLATWLWTSVTPTRVDYGVVG